MYASTRNVNRKRWIIALAVTTALFMSVAALTSSQTALAAFSFSTNTLGVSKVQSTVTTDQAKTSDGKIAISSNASTTSTAALAAPTQRVVNQPADDQAGATDAATTTTDATAAATSTAASTDTQAATDTGSSASSDVPDLAPDSGGSFDDSGAWAQGKTTVYDDGTVDPYGMTCAVSREYSYLRGSTVEVSYNGTTVYITVTDVGNFSWAGIVMDFTPGVCYALGFEPGDNPRVLYRVV